MAAIFQTTFSKVFFPVMEWSTDTKNSYDDSEVYMEYDMDMCLGVQLAEIMPIGDFQL